MEAAAPQSHHQYPRPVSVGVPVLTLVVAGWTALILLLPSLRFVVFVTDAKTGFEITLALLQIFTALVIFLFPDQSLRPRLQWVALGFALMGLGGLAFGSIIPLFDAPTNLNTAMYGSLISRSLGCSAIAVGLATPNPPAVQRVIPILYGVAGIALGVAVTIRADDLPRIAPEGGLAAAAVRDPAVMHGLTTWHWTLGLIPLFFAVVALIGVMRLPHAPPIIGWLSAALVLLVGSQIHTLLWPSGFSSILTTASILRLAFTIVIAVGALFALRRVAMERDALLTAERQTVTRLADLSTLRADFTAMVAHELASPLAAVRRSTELLTLDPLSPLQHQAIVTIQREVDVLQALIGDVHSSAVAERDDFTVDPMLMPVARLLDDARRFTRTLPNSERFTVDVVDLGLVLADAERIGQILRNLLDNAAKYSPPRTPITLQTTTQNGRVRFAVRDQGPGIPPSERERVFEKFGRGANGHTDDIPGSGLGLYIAQRIARAHGSDLALDSEPDQGTTFWFELEIKP